MKHFFAIWTAALLCGGVAFGYTNVLDNGAGQTVTNTWNAGGNLWIGDTTASNAMEIVAGGVVASADGYIGNSNAATFNAVSVAGSNAQWNVSGALYVGNKGSSNSLIVTNGGQVASQFGYIGFSSNAVGNAVLVSGSNSQWSTSANLYVGVSGSGNSLAVEEGGAAKAGGDLVVYSGNTLSLDNGVVEVGGDMGIYSNAVVSGSGSVLFSDTADNILAFDYASASISSNVLFDGQGGANTIQLTGGAQNLSAAGLSFLSHTNFSRLNLGDGDDIWQSTAADTNGTFGSVSNITGGAGSDRLAFTAAPGRMADTGVGETYFAFEAVDLGAGGSAWEITELDTLLVDGSAGSDALWMTSGVFEVSGSLSNRYVNFESLSLTNSTLGGSGVLDGIGATFMEGGVIDPDGTLVIDGSFAANGTEYQALVNATDSDLLHFTGAVDLSSMTATVTVATMPSTLQATILTADGGLGGSTFAATTVVERLLLYDVALDYAGSDVTLTATPNNEEFSSSMAYGAIQGVRAGFSGMADSIFGRTKQLRHNVVATDRTIAQNTYLMMSTNAPAGALGPGARNTIFDMHFWAQQFSGRGDYDSAGLSDAFELYNNGTTFGLDRLVGESLVLGVNYTYARSSTKAEDGDRADTEAYWLGVYGDWFSQSDLYVEGLLGYGWLNYETERVETDYNGFGKFRGSGFGGDLEAGKYFHRDNWAVAPYAGLQYLWVQSDAFTETESLGSTIQVSDQSIASLASALGAKVRNRFDTEVGRFQTTGYAEWAFDFINDDISSTLSDNLVSVGTATIQPEANLLNAGLGLSWICRDYLEIGVGYDGRFNSNYEEHIGSLMLDVRF